MFLCTDKPSNLEIFLRKFVDELKALVTNGLQLNFKTIKVKIRCFICDSPARCFLKSELYDSLLTILQNCMPFLPIFLTNILYLLVFQDVLYFNAHNGCMKCLDKGKYTDTCGVVFPNFYAEKRTNEAFRSGVYQNYHHGPTPLVDLNMDMILDFPIGDELHLIDLGVTKRLLRGWMHGKIKKKLQWSSRMKEEVSRYLKSVKRPVEIHREIRGINELSHWKGTEYRTFLLYVSVVILKKVLPKNYYDHFLLYFCSITICSAQYHLNNLIDIADKMLKSFLDLFKIMYSFEQCVSNIHNLCHLLDEVRRFGPLMTFSAYPFESKLHNIKMNLRSGHLPLSQIGKRLIEQESIPSEMLERKRSEKDVLRKKVINFDLTTIHHILPTNKCSVYAEVQLDEFVINNSDGNKFFLTHNLEIIETKFIVLDKLNQKTYIYGSAFKCLRDFFDIPFESRGLHIYIADEYELLQSKLYPIDNIKAKMFALKYAGDYDKDEDDEENLNDNKIVFVPLLHTLK